MDFTYKSKYVKVLSVSLLASTIALSGLTASIKASAVESKQITPENSEPIIISDKDKAKLTISETVTSPVVLENGKAYAFTIKDISQYVPLDTTDMIKYMTDKGYALTDLNYFVGHNAYFVGISTSATGITDKSVELFATLSNNNADIQGITGISLNAISNDVDNYELSPQNLFFVNYDSVERVVDGKVLDGTAKPNGRPYTVDLNNLFGDTIVNKEGVTYLIEYKSNITKKVNSSAKTSYLPDTFKGDSSGLVKELGKDEAVVSTLLTASNKSLLNFEAISEGSSEISITPIVNGIAIGESKKFKLNLSTAESITPEKPITDENGIGNQTDDKGDGDTGDEVINNDEDEDIIGTPKPVADDDDKGKDKNNDKDITKDSDKTPSLTDDGDDSKPNPIVTDNKPKGNDSADDGTSNIKDNNSDDDELSELPKTGQDKSNLPAYLGILALVLSGLGAVYYKVIRKTHVK